MVSHMVHKALLEAILLILFFRLIASQFLFARLKHEVGRGNHVLIGPEVACPVHKVNLALCFLAIMGLYAIESSSLSCSRTFVINGCFGFRGITCLYLTRNAE